MMHFYSFYSVFRRKGLMVTFTLDIQNFVAVVFCFELSLFTFNRNLQRGKNFILTSKITISVPLSNVLFIIIKNRFLCQKITVEKIKSVFFDTLSFYRFRRLQGDVSTLLQSLKPKTFLIVFHRFARTRLFSLLVGYVQWLFRKKHNLKN